jgi:hypothetical protein
MKTTKTILVCDGPEGVSDTLAFVKAVYGTCRVRVWAYGDDVVAVSFIRSPSVVKVTQEFVARFAA